MAVSRKREGSRSWERDLRKNPNYVRETIASLTERAAAGDADAASQLAKWLADFPEYRPAVEAVADLTARAEAAWVRLAAGGDRLAEKAALAEAEAIRAELLPPDAGAVERVLVGALIVARLAYAHAAARAAEGSPEPGVVAARDRRLSVAMARMFATAKQYRVVAAAKAGGVQPPLRLFDARGRGGA